MMVAENGLNDKYRLPEKVFGCVIGRGCTKKYYPLPAAFPKSVSESLKLIWGG
jgi:hypothetical protein